MSRIVWAQLHQRLIAQGPLKNLLPPEELETRAFWRAYATIAWISFLFAGLASMLFFASFAPNEIIALATYPVTWSAITTYTVGFLLFWILCFGCSALCHVLLALPIEQRQRQLPDPLEEQADQDHSDPQHESQK